MIFVENNNDIYSEKLDRVVQKTDFNSNLKHNSQNVYSIFNSFISLNFSKKVFEVIHFLKFLTEKKIQICYLYCSSNRCIKYYEGYKTISSISKYLF